MTEPLVTIITPTINSKFLPRALDSVANQTYRKIQHLVVFDGNHGAIRPECKIGSHVDIIQLPYSTGYVGHRIYGACIFLAKGDYLCFLDDDNWYESNHIASLIEVIRKGFPWSYSLRKIVNSEGKFICNDDCESLGQWHSYLAENDFHIDTNCYFLAKHLALQLSPVWHHPKTVDRRLCSALLQNRIKGETTGKYTVNYHVGNRPDSVQAEFFIRGNEIMQKKYGGRYPWRMRG